MPSQPHRFAPSLSFGPLVREAAALLLTLAVGTCIVVLLIFAPRSLVTGEPLTFESISTYLQAVSEYLAGLARGELGTRASGRDITHELLDAARRSLELLVVSTLVALPLGIAWGALLSSVRRGWFGALIFGFSTVIVSVPSFVLMLLAIELVVAITRSTGMQVALVFGYGLDRHLILPTFVLALRGAAFMARSLEVAQEEVMRQEWVRAARAKGLGGFTLWRRHVLPALAAPILGSALGMLRVIVSGLIIVDYLYVWGGLGRKVLETGGAVVSARREQITAGAMIMFVLFFVITDAAGRLALRSADPRLHEGARE